MELGNLGPNHKGASVVVQNGFSDQSEIHSQRIRAIRVIESFRAECASRSGGSCIIAGDICSNKQKEEVELGAHCVCGDLGNLPTTLKETFPEAIAETIYEDGISVRVDIS